MPVWLDTRTSETVDRLIALTPSKSKNDLQVSPRHTYFTNPLDTGDTHIVQIFPGTDTLPLASHLALQSLCGLPLSTYFSAVKYRWLLDNVPCVREATEDGV